MLNAEQIIKFFDMKPLPDEGGYYVETYRSREKIARQLMSNQVSSDRSVGSAILYLLTVDTFSALHKLTCDEIFHFYFGSPVTMLQLLPDGSGEICTLGHDILKGQHVQVTIPAGSWQGCFLNEGEFALMGTTTSPGFEFEDFELGHRDELLAKYPEQRHLILKLTR